MGILLLKALRALRALLPLGELAGGAILQGGPEGPYPRLLNLSAAYVTPRRGLIRERSVEILLLLWWGLWGRRALLSLERLGAP